jgi:hypothetical protein
VLLNGPYTGFWDYQNAGKAALLVYQPLAMRWRGITDLFVIDEILKGQESAWPEKP